MRRRSTTFRVLALLSALGIMLYVAWEVRAWNYYSAYVPEQFGLRWVFQSGECWIHFRGGKWVAIFEVDAATVAAFEQPGGWPLVTATTSRERVWGRPPNETPLRYATWEHVTGTHNRYIDGPPVYRECVGGQWVDLVNDTLRNKSGWYVTRSIDSRYQMFFLPSLRTLVVILH